MFAYVLWFFVILFFGILPISSVLEYRKTGIDRYKVMTFITTIPTILVCINACLMDEAKYFYYYLAIVFAALFLIAALFIGISEEEDD